MAKFTEKDEQIAKSIVCKICKNLFKDPIQLPCSENVCHSHLNDFIKFDQSNHKRYFDCCFCNQQHRIAKGFEFSANKSLGLLICTLFENDDYSEFFNECKQKLKQLIDFEKTFETKQKNDLSEYFFNLRSKVDLRREELILEIHKASDELLEQINQIEKDYLNKLKRIHSDLDFEELKAKIKLYEEHLNKYKIDLTEWTQINEKMNGDLSKLNKIKKDSNRLISSKDKFEFKDGSVEAAEKDFKNLFGQIKKRLNGRLISGSDDKSIKIWDIESSECIKSIDAHTNFVCCLELLDDDKIASGSNDKTINILDLESFECLKKIKGHTGSVNCLKKFNENELISGSGDKTIKIWDLNSGNCIKTLQGHTNFVTCLEITNDKKIISGSYDKTIKIWNYENGEFFRTLTGHLNNVLSLTLINNKIISGSADQTIKIWNIDSGECLKSLTDGQNICYRCIKPYKENQLISCSSDGNIKLWDIQNGNCLKTIKAHDGKIYSLEISKNRQIITGSSDTSIKIWNIENGECIKTFNEHLGSIYCLILYLY